MLAEQEYYEIEGHWVPEHIRKDDIDRIKESFLLVPKDVGSIIDVGCGNGIFINYVQSHSSIKELLGVDNSAAALEQVKTEKVRCDIKSIPVKDKDYDLVTAFEVIEHFSSTDSKPVLKEICRLAEKYIMLSVPNNETLAKGFVRCPQCGTRFHRNYHKRSFSKALLKELLTEYGFKCKKIKEIGSYQSYWLLTPLVYFLKKLGLKIPVMKYPAICPTCGHTPASSVKAGKSQGLVAVILEKIWPKQILGRWIIAIYDKA